MRVHDVVQFNDNHRLVGCLGIILDIEIKENDVKYKIGIPSPNGRTAYVRVLESENQIEKIGRALFVLQPINE